MMKITQKICIDLAQKRPLPRLDAVQNEAQTREIEVSLFENGVAWDIPAGTTAAVAFRKPDGTCGLYDRLPDGTDALAFSGHRVTATLAYQVLTCAGSVRVSVILYDEALNQLATFPFVLEVEENPAAGEVISNNYYNYSTLADINAAIYSASSSISRLAKRVTNLEKGILPDPFLTDDSVAYTKNVPANALPYAEITEIGGMTYKDGDTLRSAPVTAVESVGANIWDGEWYNASLNENTGVFMEGSDADVSSKNYIPVIPETQYIASAKMWVAFYDINKAFISAAPFSIEPFTTPANCYFIKFQTMKGEYGSVYKNDIVVNKGTTALPYTPYFKRTLEIPEAVQALDGYGWGVSEDVYNYVDLEKKQFAKRVGKIAFTGSEAWEKYGTKQYGMSLSAIGAKPNAGAMCDRFTQGYTGVGKFFVGLSGIAFFADYETVGEWKSYLSEQYANGTPVILYYELAEPIITDISDILPTDNFIEVEGGGTVTMANEYGADVPSKITYQIKEEG